MSMNSWMYSGYGVKVSDLNISCQNLLDVVKNTALGKNIADYSGIFYGTSEEELCELFTDFANDELAGNGIADIIAEAISEANGISIVSDTDENGNTFVLFCQAMPWEFSEKEKNLTYEQLKKLFEEFFSKFVDAPIEFGDVTVCGFG